MTASPLCLFRPTSRSHEHVFCLTTSLCRGWSVPSPWEAMVALGMYSQILYHPHRSATATSGPPVLGRKVQPKDHVLHRELSQNHSCLCFSPVMNLGTCLTFQSLSFHIHKRLTASSKMTVRLRYNKYEAYITQGKPYYLSFVEGKMYEWMCGWMDG